MTETSLRIVVVVVVLSVAALVAAGQRRGVAVRRRRRTFPGVDPGLVVFTSADCAMCSTVRGVLDSLGVEYTEIGYESDPDMFDALGIDLVPAVAHIEGSGTGWISHGVPSRARLARWIADP